MNILISACLLGENCKYNGGNNYNSAVSEFMRDKEVLPDCLEMMFGMGSQNTHKNRGRCTDGSGWKECGCGYA